MNDRPKGGERVVLVHVNFSNARMKEDLSELKELAVSAGAHVVDVLSCTREVPHSKYFIGTGKAEMLRQTVTAHQADLVIFNHVLTPAQERNLERLISCRVLDRTGLILDIFAQRARSFEGKLQVELAMLKHLSSRLVRGWTHLERQQGGIGLRGPGETQLEVDRRLIRHKIKLIDARLAKIRQQREQSRQARQKAILPTIALVGYTNAGKSTLFNRLTGEHTYAANQLFATLDPTLRRVSSIEMGEVIFADTVGFIRHLPHDLIEAFHATLEEVAQADLLLHIVDASDDKRHEHLEEVNQVLAHIHADHVPKLLVYNKIDLNPDLKVNLDRDDLGKPWRVFISALSGLGFAELFSAVGELLGNHMALAEIMLLPGQGKIRAQLYQQACVLHERVDEQGCCYLQVRMPKTDLALLRAKLTHHSENDS